MRTSPPRSTVVRRCTTTAAGHTRFDGLPALEQRVSGCHRRYLVVDHTPRTPHEGTWHRASAPVDLMVLHGELCLDYVFEGREAAVTVGIGEHATIPGNVAYRLSLRSRVVFELYLPETDSPGEHHN